MKPTLVYLDVLTSIIAGDRLLNERNENPSMPILLLDAEQRQQITTQDYEIWFQYARNVLFLIKEIDNTLLQLGGHKSPKAGKLFNKKQNK